MKNIFEFFVNNTRIHNENNEEITFESTISAGDIFSLIIINALILVFTIGFGYPWVITRSNKLYMSRITMKGNINLNNIQQTEADYKDATGEDLGDMLELDLI